MKKLFGVTILALGLATGALADDQTRTNQLASQKLNEQMGALVIQNIQLAAQVQTLQEELTKAQQGGKEEAPTAVTKPLTAK